MYSLTDGAQTTPPLACRLDEGMSQGGVASSRTHSRDKNAAEPRTEAIYEALWANDLLRHLEYGYITVKVDGHTAIFSGHVTAAHTRRWAEEAAAQVPGVDAVKNGLVDDEALVSLVCRALTADPRVEHEGIFVAVRHGVVILSGTVSSLAARDAAEECAAGVQQVRAVCNYTEAPGPVVADPGIERVLQPAIGEEVIAVDMPIGRVDGVVISPRNRRVTAIVTRGEFPVPASQGDPNGPDRYDVYVNAGRERWVVIPVQTVDQVTPAAVWLRIRASEAAVYPDFDPAFFRRPETSWKPPYPYEPEDVWLDEVGR